MDLKYVTGPITKADAGGLEAVISTPKVDKDGESVDPLGLENRDEWLTNPLIYWAHEWAFNPTAEPIGKGTRLDVAPDAITSAAIYAPTPKAQNVRALVTGGFVRKTSIGFDSAEMADVKGVPTHTRWALREWSVVPMPANTDATIVGVKSALRWLADEIAEPTEEIGAQIGDAVGSALTISLDAADLIAKLEEVRLLLVPQTDGVSLVDNGRRIATIRRRRVAFFPTTHP